MVAPYFSASHTVPDILMAILAPCFSMKKCPPMPANGVLPDEPAFGNRYKQPISVEFHADGEVTSTGFAFEDYHFAQTRIRKSRGERRLPTPSWAFNYSEQRELVARFWELRANMKYPRIDTAAKRLRYAYRKYMREVYPRLLRTLKELSLELVSCTDPKRREELIVEIQGTDTQLRIAWQGPGIVVGIIHAYYGVGLDSVGTGAEFGIRPVSVRQTLHRLHGTWQSMVDGTDRKPKPEEVRRARGVEKERRWRKEHPDKYAAKKAKTQAFRDAKPRGVPGAVSGMGEKEPPVSQHRA